MVKPIGSPALTVGLGIALVAPSAVLMTERLGHWTMTLAELVPPPSLVEVATAVLLTVPQVAKVVGLEICTDMLVFGAIVAKVQLKTPAVIEQPVTAVVIVQLKPVPVGRVSVTSTPVAVPAPVLETVMVKPIVSPALTDGVGIACVAPSAVLTIPIFAQLTVVVALAEIVAWLVADAEAVLG